MDGSSYGPRGVGFGFQPSPAPWQDQVGTTPLHEERDPPPEREWGLSAWQVVTAVLLIVAGCELIGWLS